MDFSYVEEVSDLHQVVKVARRLRGQYITMASERKRLMKQARDTGNEELSDLMKKVRPPAWFMVTECEECPHMSLVSSNWSLASRFLCGACRQPASVAWIEEGSEDKVLAMYDTWAAKQASKEIGK